MGQGLLRQISDLMPAICKPEVPAVSARHTFEVRARKGAARKASSSGQADQISGVFVGGISEAGTIGVTLVKSLSIARRKKWAFTTVAILSRVVGAVFG